MKNILIWFFLLLPFIQINAQSYKKEGNNFKLTTTSRQTTKSDTLVTKFTFEDNKGNQYPIIINKNSGSCYIWRTSSKTGKPYKQYMKPEISQAICKELGIEYKSKKK